MDDKIAQIPYFAHEGEMMRSECQIRRLIAVIIMLIVLTIVTNIMWIWFVMHYDVVKGTESSSVSDSEQSEAGHV